LKRVEHLPSEPRGRKSKLSVGCRQHSPSVACFWGREFRRHSLQVAFRTYVVTAVAALLVRLMSVCVCDRALSD